MDVKKSFLKFYILLFIILTAFTLTVKTDVYALDAQAIAEDLDHYFVPAFPDTYGQIIDRCFTEEEVNPTCASPPSKHPISAFMSSLSR